jgi:hypothetical protein
MTAGLTNQLHTTYTLHTSHSMLEVRLHIPEIGSGSVDEYSKQSAQSFLPWPTSGLGYEPCLLDPVCFLVHQSYWMIRTGSASEQIPESVP